jgi:hypothetical protein
MQVVVSISLQTLSSRCVPAPAIGPGWAEIFWIRNVPRSLMCLPFEGAHLQVRRYNRH